MSILHPGDHAALGTAHDFTSTLEVDSQRTAVLPLDASDVDVEQVNQTSRSV